jgi:hypothetical protein
MSDFPKWLPIKDAHDIDHARKTHQTHDDRVAGEMVLVHDAEDEATVLGGVIEHEVEK